MPVKNPKRDWIIGLVLFAITVALYWPAMSFPFVDYDDYFYVYNNPDVSHGLSGAGIKYAFTTVVAGNWHPLTVLAHMADCSLFGQNAGEHHFINILFHGINTVLLWILLRRLTGGFWPSVLGAALFGWHPLNVESVAWVSELKNVLSTFFFLLTLLAYLRYAQKPKPAAYLLALGFFALGLLAKPMLVTVPCVLLLLDYWPLKRIIPPPVSAKAGMKKNTAETTPTRFLLWEKIPFFVLAAADSVVTYLIQNSSGAVVSLAAVPMSSRLMNVPVAYITYLEKMMWPSNLCCLYSFPDQLPVAPTLIGLALLGLGSFAAWRWREKYRWLAVGWLWFLGTLVPVIGLVHFGAQAWADRYAYLPLIGIFLIVVCGLNELWKARTSWRPFLLAGCVLFPCACVALSWQQISYWRDSVVLFNRALAVNPNNTQAQNLLGVAYTDTGDFDDAIAHFSVAVRLHPRNAEYQYNLGRALMGEQKFVDAENPLATAVNLQPDDNTWRNTLGAAYLLAGQPQPAAETFSQAIARQPQFAMSYYNLGIVLLQQQQASAAITNFLTAVKLQPDWPEARARLGVAYAATGDLSNAVASASLALTAAQAKHDTALADQISAELNSFQTSQPAQH